MGFNKNNIVVTSLNLQKYRPFAKYFMTTPGYIGKLKIGHTSIFLFNYKIPPIRVVSCGKIFISDMGIKFTDP